MDRAPDKNKKLYEYDNLFSYFMPEYLCSHFSVNECGIHLNFIYFIYFCDILIVKLRSGGYREARNKIFST